MFRLTLLCLILAVLVGCSLQSHAPAPVETAGSKKKSALSRGSLTSDSYRVKKGDTLYSIAWAAGTDYLELAKINQLNKPYTIYPGQILSLSGRASVTKSTSATKGVNNQSRGSVASGKLDKKQFDSPVIATAGAGASASKKTLDQQNKADYSVTSSQQKSNQDATQTDGLPDQVARWMWPATGRLVGSFSAREQGSKGIKIAGRRGDPIRSAAEGRVVYAGNALRGYGNLVIIKHSEDFLSAYAHLDKILVTEKQQVSAGQTVATMGNTDSQHVVLHFEIRLHGVSVNPLKYLPKQ